MRLRLRINSSHSPHLRVAKYHLGWITIASNWIDNDANSSRAVCVVIHTVDELVVHEQSNAVPLCYHGNEVGLVQTLFDSRTGTVQFHEIPLRVSAEKELVISILTDLEYIEVIVRTIITDDDSATTAIDNLHLHLKDEVAEGWVGGTVLELV